MGIYAALIERRACPKMEISFKTWNAPTSKHLYVARKLTTTRNGPMSFQASTTYDYFRVFNALHDNFQGFVSLSPSGSLTHWVFSK